MNLLKFNIVSGSGFNTFGFMAMMLTAFNAVNLVASNVNNRRNNNNNNNNDNNDNNNQDNEAKTEGEVMNPANMIILPPILPGRSLHLHEKTLMRRSLSPFKLGPIEGLKVKPSIYGVTYAAFIDILLASLRYQVSGRSIVYVPQEHDRILPDDHDDDYFPFLNR